VFLVLVGGSIGIAFDAGNLSRLVMPGLDPGIHVLLIRRKKTWMAGSDPVITKETYEQE
jgi:hypothetical protein